MRKGAQTGQMHPSIARHLPRMSSAVELGQFIKITCQHCRVTHRYDPGDLIKVLGDVPFLNIHENFHCSKCGKRDYLSAGLETPCARERVGMRVRRLVEIRTVQKPVWKDVTL